MIRLYQKEDEEKVRKYCNQYNKKFPTKGILFVAFDGQGEVRGICGLKKEYFIEPLIAEDPMTAFTLGKMAEGLLVGEGEVTVRATVPGKLEKHINQLEKEGFVILDENITLMEKYYG